MEYDKPYRSFDELLTVLVEKHGLTSPLPSFAKDVLIGTSYYDLINGYKSHFMENDRFREGVTFENIYWFHLFDRGFQNVLFELSIVIEEYFKNVLAHVLAKNFGVDTSEYLAPDNFLPYHGKGRHKLSRDRLLKDLRYQYEHPRDDPTRYYAKNHNHIPPWIFLKNMTFSDSINLFTLLKRDEKKEILHIMLPPNMAYQDAVPILRYILTMVRRCRNSIAHGLKFTEFDASSYGKNLSKKALRTLIPVSLLTDDELADGRLLYGVYGYIFFCLVLVRFPFEKILLSNHIVRYMVPNIPQSSSSARLWAHLSVEYFNALHIPLNFTSRLVSYVKEANGFVSVS